MQRATSTSFLVAALVVLAACGSDGSDAVTSSSGPASTSATTAPTTPVSPSSTAGAGVLTPEVECFDGVDTYRFSYSYTGDAPLVLPIGDANAVAGGEPGDNPLQPTIFAPGEHVPAFWKMTGDDPITWNLTGPDGETRSVTADESAPDCETAPNLLDGTELVVTPGTPTLSDDGSTASLEIQIAGLPATSTCPAGLDPLPMTLFTGGDPNDATPTTLTVTVATAGSGNQVADFRPDIWGLDHCAFEGEETVTWSDQVYTDIPLIFCYVVQDGTFTESDSLEDCPYIPPTGGGRIRPTDSTTTAAT